MSNDEISVPFHTRFRGVCSGSACARSPPEIHEKGRVYRVKNVRVLVVDDFEPWLHFVDALLEDEREMYIVGRATDGVDAVRQMHALQPDIVLMDIGLPTFSGIEAARQIRRLMPDIKVIFVSQYSDPEIIQEALAAGGRGYILKSTAGKELMFAIEAVLLGKRYVSRRLQGFDLTETTDA